MEQKNKNSATKKRKLSTKEDLKLEKKKKIVASIVCKCSPPIKCLSNKRREVDNYVCSHVFQYYRYEDGKTMASGDRIFHQDYGNGYIMGVAVLQDDEHENYTRCITIKFDSYEGCLFIKRYQPSFVTLIYRNKNPDDIVDDITKCLAKKILNEIYENKKGCDVMIRCKKSRFLCHRHILSQASEHFMAMFNTGFKESFDVSTMLELPEDDPEHIDILIRHIYAIDITITGENIFELYLLAKKYMVGSLQSICLSRLYHLLNNNIVFKITNMCIEAKEDKCLKECIDYIEKNLDLLLDTHENDLLKFLQPRVINVDMPEEMDIITILRTGLEKKIYDAYIKLGHANGSK